MNFILASRISLFYMMTLGLNEVELKLRSRIVTCVPIHAPNLKLGSSSQAFALKRRIILWVGHQFRHKASFLWCSIRLSEH